MSRLLRMSNLNETLAGTTFDELRPDAGAMEQASSTRSAYAVETAEAYAANPEGWLMVLGPGGSGKTRLAAAVAAECIRRGRVVFFISVADLLDHLRSAYAPSSALPYDELFDRVRNVPLLVLDDLGYQSATPWAQEKLSQLLGHRYHSRMPTVLTISAPLETMDDRLRPRLQDPSLVRAVEMGSISAKTSSSLDTLDLPEVSHMTFETFNPSGRMVGPMAEGLREAWGLAKSFAEDPDGWLVFVGGYGCGKTHLAASIAHHHRSVCREVLFTQVPDLLDKLRAGFQPEGDPAYEVFDRVKRVGVLILDDFSEQSDTPWSREKLYQMLNYRYLTRLPTVVTSSVEPEQMDPRIWSRMNDSSLSVVYEIRAPDYRTGVIHRPRSFPQERPKGRGRPKSSSA